MTVSEIEQRLGYTFNDTALLTRALRHRSIGQPNNERLEFLGDATLGLIIASELFRQQPNATEGELSRLRASLVNGDVLAKIAMGLGLDDVLVLGAGEQRSGGRRRRSICAGAVEAVIGAIYLDSHLQRCQQCVLDWYAQHAQITDLSATVPIKDAKTVLQEWCQQQHYPLPNYQAKSSGPAHALVYQVRCRIKPYEVVGEGKHSNRRRAEQQAAEQILRWLKQHDKFSTA